MCQAVTTHSAAIPVLSVAIQQVPVAIQAEERPPVITIPATIHGLAVPTMSIVQTAANISAPAQATAPPIQVGLAVIGTNTAMTVTS